MLNELEKTLLEQYQDIYKKRTAPYWAAHYYPPIPLIGKNYRSAPIKILAYTGTESRSIIFERGRKAHIIDKLDNDVLWYRHRYFLNYDDKDNFFPFVHNEPIDNGSLPTVLKYIVEHFKCREQFGLEPRDLLEQITTGHFGKFIVNNPIDRDYYRNSKKLSQSMDYISEDIKLLQPDIIIIPKTISDVFGDDLVDKFKKIMRAIGRKEMSIMKLYKINKQTIRCHINKKIGEVPLEILNDEWIKRSSLDDIENYITWIKDNVDKTIVKIKY